MAGRSGSRNDRPASHSVWTRPKKFKRGARRKQPDEEITMTMRPMSALCQVLCTLSLIGSLGAGCDLPPDEELGQVPASTATAIAAPAAPTGDQPSNDSSEEVETLASALSVQKLHALDRRHIDGN